MAQTKFLRSYTLSITFPTEGYEPITLTDPLTCEFDITRNLYSSASVCQLRIYNLSSPHRTTLRYDINNRGINRVVTFKAGFGITQSVLFTGNVSQAWSSREGNNYITTIECFDGGFAQTNCLIPSDANFPANTSYYSVLTYLMGLLNTIGGVGFGAISPSFYKGANGQLYTYSKAFYLVGDAYNNLQTITNHHFFIDGNKSFILADNDVFQPSEYIINSSSGLLGTPNREQTLVTFDMILEPSLAIGQQINLQSSTYDNVSVNGPTKIIGLKHRGVISGAVCGDAITSVTFNSLETAGLTLPIGGSPTP